MRFLLLLFATCVSALSASWYVDPAATGTGAGTSWGNAWTTLAAINWSGMASSGDTLYISGSTGGRTYSEKLEISFQRGAGSRLTIRCGQDAGHTGRVTLYDSTATTDCIRLGNGGDGTEADNVTIDGSYNGAINIYLTNGLHGINHRYDSETNNIYKYLDVSTRTNSDTQTHGIELGAFADGTEVAYCNIHNTADRGIREGNATVNAYGRISIHHSTFSYNSDDPIAIDGGVDVYNNVFNGVGSDPSTHPDGFQGVKGFWRVYNNVFHDHTQEIFIETTATSFGSVQIYNNIFYDIDNSSTSPAIIFRAKQPTGAHTWTNIVIANNVFYGMKLTAVRLSADPGITVTVSGSKMDNNIFAGNSGNTLMNDVGEGTFTWGAGDFPWRNNIFNSPETLYYKSTLYSTVSAFQAGETDCTGNLSTAPTFTNSGAQDFTMSLGSVGIDSGRTLTEFSTDFTGASRPQGSAWDIGAYEFVVSSGGGGGSPPAPPVYNPIRGNFRVR